MESNFDVCMECGSFLECKHDTDAEDKPGPESDEIDYLEMRMIRSVPPHSEVFNTYGSLSNATLLTRYGFMLPENEFDVVRLGQRLPPSSTRVMLPWDAGSPPETISSGTRQDVSIFSMACTVAAVTTWSQARFLLMTASLMMTIAPRCPTLPVAGRP
ncbi:hypothetical protein EDD15DRAFT_616255 [Pisolithus albus]|nr:hypothetical protein EDD15DRAFT_616255 [Pisolithus albus]